MNQEKPTNPVNQKKLPGFKEDQTTAFADGDYPADIEKAEITTGRYSTAKYARNFSRHDEDAQDETHVDEVLRVFFRDLYSGKLTDFDISIKAGKDEIYQKLVESAFKGKLPQKDFFPSKLEGRKVVITVQNRLGERRTFNNLVDVQPYVESDWFDTDEDAEDDDCSDNIEVSGNTFYVN